MSLSLSLSLSLSVCVCVYIYTYIRTDLLSICSGTSANKGVLRGDRHAIHLRLWGAKVTQGKQRTCLRNKARQQCKATMHLLPKPCRPRRGEEWKGKMQVFLLQNLVSQKRRGMERKDASFSSSKPCIPEEERNGKERCKFCPFFCFSQITTWQNQTGVIQSASLVRISKHLVICDL